MSPAPSTRPLRSSPILLLALLLLAFVLRLFRLEVQSLWWDEGISLHLATSTLAEIMANRAANLHPPLYFFILKGWLRLVGLSPFTARYLSLLASWLQVAAVFSLSRRWFNQKIAITATLLTALSPLSIIYAQEIRVYALLPLFYLLLLYLTSYLLQPATNASLRHWVLLGLLEWLGFHLHYIAAFALVFTSLWLLIALYQQKRWTDLRRWLGVQFVCGLAAMPWLWLVWLNRTAVTIEANAGTYLTDPTPISHLLAQVWTFHLTGLPGSLSRPLIQLLIIFIVLALLLLLVLRAASPVLRRTLLAWLIPLIFAFLAWSVRSFAHPRYVTIFAIMLMPLVAGLVGDWKHNLQSLIANLLLVALISLSLVALNLYYFDPGVAKDDMRGIARYLEAEANPDDLILVPDSDWSLPFEYQGVAQIAMPQAAKGTEMWANLQELTQTKQRVFLVEYRQGSVDWQDVVPFALEQVGNLEKKHNFGNLFIQAYRLDRAVAPPIMQTQATQFELLSLTAVSTPPTAPPANNALTLALQWQPTQPLPTRYHIALRLLDADGWQLAQLDRVLVDTVGRPTELWQPGDTITTYHTLPLPLGLSPLTYDLGLTVYAQTGNGLQPLEMRDEQGAPQGQQWLLPPVTLAPSRGVANPYHQSSPVTQWQPPLSLTDGLILWGMEVDRTEVGAGQPISVQLQWQATQPLTDLRPSLQIVQDDQILAEAGEAPALGRYPMTLWQNGEMVVEHRRLLLPATAVGPAQLIIRLDEKQWPLAGIQISDTAHQLAPPLITYPLDIQFGDVARLVGYDLPQTAVTNNETVPLTLYWQSLTDANPVDYVVFSHILAEDGHLVGQHDSVPVNGSRPTTTWITNEYITDPHQLSFREAYTGNGRIEVGLYDPLTGTRLQTAAGPDFFYLPITLEVK